MSYVYLDNAATTPLCNEAKKAMIDSLDKFGNPSSLHFLGKESKQKIEESRELVANLIGASPDKVFFTSGGTESNKWVLSEHTSANPYVLVSEIEHHAVTNNIRSSWGLCSVNKKGEVDAFDYIKKKAEECSLVSMMMVNNEIGSVQPIKEIVKTVKSNSSAFVHTDAVQAVGKIKIDVNDLGVDFLSLSGHKIHGPKGVGALYVRNPKETLSPLICGGSQEQCMRSGTENFLGIIGMGAAAKFVSENKPDKIEELTKKLYFRIKEEISGAYLNGNAKNFYTGILNIFFKDVEAKRLVSEMSKRGICISSGSACNERSVQPSHVLKAIKLTNYQAHSSVRFSVSRLNKKSDIDKTVESLKILIPLLRNDF